MKKKAIYQIFTRLYCNPVQSCSPWSDITAAGCGKLQNITSKILDGIRESGYTDIWFTGILAHASKTDYSQYGIPCSHHSTVKGNAGSPYAIRDYYDIDPDLAVSIPDRMKEFQSLVDRVHAAGLGFIMDFVPNHVAREYHSICMPEGVKNLGENDDINKFFSPGNNFYYITGESLNGEIDWDGYTEYPAKATGNDRFTSSPSNYDWYETVKLNYGKDYGDGSRHFKPVPDTWLKMTDILLFWAGKGVDAFRCDMAEMVPVEFWNYAIKKVRKQYKKVEFIAEIYNPGSYSSYIEYGGFNWLYDKVGLYDTLRAIVESRESATAITRCWQNTGDNGPHMLHFMENHDEQRIASDFFAGNPIKGRPAMVVSALMDTCPVMVYAGQEFGERGMEQEGFSGMDGRTSIFDYWSPDTLRRKYNKGKFDESKLTEAERDLSHFYSRLMNIATTEKAVSTGKFFDLMYVNPQSAVFNPHTQYAFLRADKTSCLLVVTNFADRPADCEVLIPQHAFDYLGLTVRDSCTATELLTGTKLSIQVRPDCCVRLQVPSYFAAILKFKR